MCKVGDILLIFNARNKRAVGMHPFIVLDDRNGKVSGVYSYDFIGVLLTSADTEEKKERLKRIDGNFPIAENDKISWMMENPVIIDILMLKQISSSISIKTK